MTNNRHISKKRLMAAAIAIGAAAIGTVSLESAHAVTLLGPTITVTGPTSNDAELSGVLRCRGLGYAAARIDNSVTNANGTVTNTVTCYTHQ